MVIEIFVVKAARQGCFMRNLVGLMNWFPAYCSCLRDNTINDVGTSKIADTIGAGNAFLGAFTVGFVCTGDLAEAAI